MTYLLIINIYQLLMSINTYVYMFFVLHEVLNMKSIIVYNGVSTPTQNLLNMETVYHEPPLSPLKIWIFQNPHNAKILHPHPFF